MKFRTTTWQRLRPGNVIVCPVSGLTEKVTASRRGAGERWFVRTNRHDHIRPRDETVEVQSKCTP